MIGKIDHVGVAVRDLDQAQKLYADLLGMEFEPRETVAEQKVTVAKGIAGESHVELLEPTEDSSPIARFLEKRGEGIHHLCLQVESLEDTLKRFREAGMRLIDEEPRIGAGGKRIAFVHPASTAGVLLELSEG